MLDFYWFHDIKIVKYKSGLNEANNPRKSKRFSIVDLFRFKSLRGMTLGLMLMDFVIDLLFYTPTLMLDRFRFNLLLYTPTLMVARFLFNLLFYTPPLMLDRFYFSIYINDRIDL